MKILPFRAYRAGMLRSLCRKTLRGKVKVVRRRLVCRLPSRDVGERVLQALLTAAPAPASASELARGVRIAR